MSEDKQSGKQGEEQAFPGLSKMLQHRISTKWLTMESLRILQDRIIAHGGRAEVTILTPNAWITGTLADIRPDYEHSVGALTAEDLDVPSAVVHLRSTLWDLYAKEDDDLTPVDSAAIIHIVNGTVKIGARQIRFPHFAVFASDVIGFTMTQQQLM